MTGLQMKYFVLSPLKDNLYGGASRSALLLYATIIEPENPKLARDLQRWVEKIRTNSNKLNP